MDRISAPPLIGPLHYIDLKHGKFHGTNAVDLNNVFDNIKKQGPGGRLCIFFHGGLTSEADGLNTASELINNYAEAGAYPFFFIWQSDLITTVKSILEPFSDDPIFVSAANHAVKMLALKIAKALDTDRSLKSRRLLSIGRKTAPLPLKELALFAEPYDRAWAKRAGVQLALTSSELDQFAQWLTDTQKAFPVKRRLFSSKNLRGPQNPLAMIVRRFNTGRDHGVYTTVIEELLIAAGVADHLGAPIWGRMKQFIDDSFSNDTDAGGTAFLKHLCETWDSNPQLKVTLIGHSAGAIYVQRFIEALDERLPSSSTLRVEVITLAAAITFERMSAGLSALRKRVRGIRVFGLNDKRESAYWEVPLVYNKSLLYIVSSLCEADSYADKPLVGMQRYWNGVTPYTNPDIQAVTKFVELARSVWSPTGASAKVGYRSEADRHGCFPEDKATNASVCAALRSGV